jgi:hypothetical protein
MFMVREEWLLTGKYEEEIKGKMSEKRRVNNFERSNLLFTVRRQEYENLRYSFFFCTFCNVQKATRQKQTVLSYLTTHTPKDTSIHYGIHQPPGTPAHEAAKIQAFFDYKRSLEAKHAYSYDRIINMDETPVNFNNSSKKTVHYGLTKDPVAVKVMEGNQRARVAVMLTCTKPVIS